MSKKLFVFAIAELILTAILITCYTPKNRVSFCAADDIVRIHIIANSNEQNDLDVKSDIKDYLTDFLARKNANNADNTLLAVEENQTVLNSEINDILTLNGFSYTADVFVGSEDFPVRLYDDVLTQSGNYKTIKVVLGEGRGDNWWCVAYPKLCLNKEKKKVTFKSRIVEWFKGLFN